MSLHLTKCHIVGNLFAAAQLLWSSQNWWYVYDYLVGKSAKAIPKHASLSPKTEEFTENIEQAHHQTCVMKNALNSDPPDMSPTEFG